MISPDNLSMFLKVLDMFKDVILGIVGGIVAYLYDYTTAKKKGDETFSFSWALMFINALLGAFVAYTVGDFVPLDVSGRDAIIGFSGVTSYNIIMIAQGRFAKWLEGAGHVQRDCRSNRRFCFGAIGCPGY